MNIHLQIGIDEAGRGCLCGPVCASSVAFINKFSQIEKLADSKVLSTSQRENLVKNIKKETLWGLGWVYPHEIDAINIHNASLLAMQRSFFEIKDKIKFLFTDITPKNIKIVVDGKFPPPLSRETYSLETIIRGDSKVNEIKAASILAKTARDSHMKLLDRAYPQYHIAIHKGYPTKTHQQTLSRYGATPIHRKSFKLHYNR